MISPIIRCDLILRSRTMLKYEEETTDEQAAHASDSSVLTNVADAYFFGLGMKTNYRQAFIYYKKAAALGDIIAKEQLGLCYEKGLGTDIDLAEAMNCYEDASDLGSAVGSYRLGDFYYKGIPGLAPKDQNYAYSLYMSSLMACYMSDDYLAMADVHMRLAECMEYGNGVLQDKEQALAFYELAAEEYEDRVISGDMRCEELLDQAETHAEALKKELAAKQEQHK